MIPGKFICKTEGCEKEGTTEGRMYFNKKDKEKYPCVCPGCGNVMEETEIEDVKLSRPWYESNKRYTEKRGMPKGLSNEKKHPDQHMEDFERDRQSGDFFH